LRASLKIELDPKMKLTLVMTKNSSCQVIFVFVIVCSICRFEYSWVQQCW